MDLTERLRKQEYAGLPIPCCEEAAVEIERLRAENQALREALECIAGGEIYPREVAREALAAKGE